MQLRRFLLYAAVLTISIPRIVTAQGSTSSAAPKHTKKAATPIESTLDSGSIANGVYRNKMLGLSCEIPAGWVLRTDEMNSSEEDGAEKAKSAQASANASAKVLLAAFSRPPGARAEDVNASVLIAAEPAAFYPGLNDAAQYFGPLTEVAKAQGFAIDEEPYGFAVGTKTLVRGDFHKDVGSRVMRQSTLAMLSHGYAVSITIIAGTEDEMEELIDGLTFASTAK